MSMNGHVYWQHNYSVKSASVSLQTFPTVFERSTGSTNLLRNRGETRLLASASRSVSPPATLAEAPVTLRSSHSLPLPLPLPAD